MVIFNGFYRKILFPFGTILLVMAPTVSAYNLPGDKHHTASPAGANLDFVAHPQSRVVEVGKTTGLAVLTKGPVKTIQWRKNGSPVEGGNGQYIEVSANEQPNELNPERYDVVIQDAFGKQAISRVATVTTLPKGNAGVTAAFQREESLKLQSLLNLVDVFKQVAFRIEEAWDGDLLNQATLHRYEVCPGDLVSEAITPMESPEQVHKATKLEFKNCYLPRSDLMGEESGAVVSGTFIHSEKKVTLHQGETLQTELFAKNLGLRFPFSAASARNPTIDFDIKLNGKLIHSIQTNYLGETNQRSLEEYQWTSGTQIENPQTGVVATILSGKYSIEQFGETRGGRYVPLRETRYFNNLKLKVGDDNVLIRGLVSRIGSDSDLQRSGTFEIQVNGKAVVQAPSAVSPVYKPGTQLPFSPKLNRFFNNDHRPLKNKQNQQKPKAELKVSGVALPG